MKTYCTATDPPHEVKVEPRKGGHGISYDPRDLICEEHQIPLKTKGELKPRKALRRVSEKRQGEVRRRGSTLKQGKGFAASPAQRKKVKDLPCIVCGVDRFVEGFEIEAAHVYPRRLQSCECAEGVVPLCHTCHLAYDRGEIDLLPYLGIGGYKAELVHAVAEHGAPISELLRIVTGVEWKPVEKKSPTCSRCVGVGCDFCRSAV